MTKPLLKNSKYNPLTEEEWERFASLIDFSQVPKQERKKVLDMFKASAEVHPMVRRLYREQTASFVISLTDDDMYRLEENNCYGDANGISVSWRRDLKEIPATAVHEILHIQQMEEKMWADNSSREFAIIANKLQESEAECVSAYLSSRSGDFFDRLVDKNEYYFKQDFKNGKLSIPYEDGLTKGEKIKARDLYIHEQAVEKSMGQYVALLMQENGAPTQEMAASFGLYLTQNELGTIEYWRKGYKEQAILFSKRNHSIHEAGLNPDEKKEAEHVRDRMVERYPVLMDLPFFQTGFSEEDALEAGISIDKNKKTHTTYFEGTDKVLSERKIEDGGYVTRVYRNTGKHALIYELREDFLGRKDGKETFYDYNDQVAREMTYKNGNLLSDKGYYEDGTGYLEEYENGQLVNLTEFDKSGKVTYTKDYKNVVEENRTVEYGAVREGIKNVIERYDEIGTYRTTVYNDGRCKEGYLTNDEIPVGSWKLTSTTGAVKNVFYSGKAVVDPKTGKKVAERIKNPLVDLVKDGFVCGVDLETVEEDLKRLKKQEFVDETVTIDRFYVKQTGDSVEFAYLTPNGLLMRTGEYKEDLNEGVFYEVGTWKDYNKYSELVNVESYDNYGTYLRGLKFEASTGRITAHTFRDGDITRTYSLDLNNRRTMESAYDIKEDKYLEYKERHENGSVSNILDQDGNWREFEKNGGLSSIYNTNRAVEFYPEAGVNDLNKLMLKSETIYLSNEESDTLTRKTEYRKDGTILSISEVDTNGNGRQVFFGTDGETKTAEGELKDWEKSGAWNYYKGKIIRTVNYEEGKIVSGGELIVSNFDAQYTMQKLATERPTREQAPDASGHLSQNAGKVDVSDQSAQMDVIRSSKNEGR